MQRPTLGEIFAPRGVAVVGASEIRGFASGNIAALKAAGFPNIYPVNPKYTEVMGLPCYPNLKDIPGIVDHVIVSIPAETAMSLLDDCTVKKVKSVHFFTAGFSESGDQTRANLERAMLEKAIDGGFRIIGPNCTGLFVPGSKLVNMIGVPIEPGPVAFISQSGGHANNLPLYGSPKGIRFSKVISYGNCLDIDESELLQYLADDTETEIIACYIEGVKNGRRFIDSLSRAAIAKPVIIYKGGVTEAGKRAAFGHTASLTSSVAIFETICRQVNAIRVDDLDEMVDVLVALRFMKPLPAGKTVVIMGAGGGPSVLASDETEKAGLYPAPLSQETRQDLMKFLPLAGSIFVNPIDAGNLATPEAITATLKTISRLPEIDMMIYHLGFHPISGWGTGRFANPDFLGSIAKAFTSVTRASGKPVLLALRPPMEIESMKEFLACQEALVKSGLPVFNSLKQAARAASQTIEWKKRLLSHASFDLPV